MNTEYQPNVEKLAALGWSLIPCGLNKKPLIGSWKPHQANPPTVEQLRKWHEDLNPPAWAVITGAISGLVVADFDGKGGQELLRTFGLDPHVRSGSGGKHAYHIHPGWHVPTLNWKVTRELGKRWRGLDIRGDGGYAVCLGRSRYGEYQWLPEPVPDSFELLPADLRGFLRQAHSSTPASQQSGKMTNLDGERVAATLLIERALDQIPNIGRNNSGFWLATQLRDNRYSGSEAEPIMLEYAARVPGVNLHGEPEAYTRRDALASLEQAFHRQPREPWKIPGAKEGFKNQVNVSSLPSAVNFFERQTQPRQEIIEGILREKQLVAFAEPFTVGKSPLLADITVHRIHGTSWCGRAIRGGPVLRSTALPCAETQFSSVICTKCRSSPRRGNARIAGVASKGRGAGHFFVTRFAKSDLLTKEGTIPRRKSNYPGHRLNQINELQT